MGGRRCEEKEEEEERRRKRRRCTRFTEFPARDEEIGREREREREGGNEREKEREREVAKERREMVGGCFKTLNINTRGG